MGSNAGSRAGSKAGSRAAYRVWQFGRAAQAYLRNLTPDEWAQVERVLPGAAAALYRAMPRPDQRHAFRVLRALRTQGRDEADVLQAALLHDVAKHLGGVTLFHRVVAVLLKKFRPATWRSWATAAEPDRRDARYPFWAHAHHPELSAVLAAQAGCSPAAVRLIALHQDGAAANTREAELLATLRAADDDN